MQVQVQGAGQNLRCRCTLGAGLRCRPVLYTRNVDAFLEKRDVEILLLEEKLISEHFQPIYTKILLLKHNSKSKIGKKYFLLEFF